MEIKVGCRLRYETSAPTPFVFQIEAAKGDSQIVKSETLALPFPLYVPGRVVTQRQ
jgi:hypothetical protein